MRAALYALPSGELLERAEVWLGRSTREHAQGASPFPPPSWDSNLIEANTVDARRYGFHATLKAPFRLAPGRTLAELEDAVARFAAVRSGVEIPQLTLALLSGAAQTPAQPPDSGLRAGFFALVPQQVSPVLDELAAALVTQFERFRAPATAQEIERRNPESLSPRQRRLLAEWGYPYVFEEFFFHLTLTDRIEPASQEHFRALLSEWFAPALTHPMNIDALAIFTEPTPGAPFMLHSLHRLSPGAP